MCLQKAKIEKKKLVMGCNAFRMEEDLWPNLNYWNLFILHGAEINVAPESALLKVLCQPLNSSKTHSKPESKNSSMRKKN